MKRFLKLYPVLIILTEILSINCSNSRIISQVRDENVLTGEWVVIYQTISPLDITPHCKSIQQGTTFHFRRDTLEVFVKESGEPCSAYPFKIAGNTISVSKGDMVWLCTFQIKSDTLNITSDSFFTPHESGISSLPTHQPTEKQAIVVTLKRKTN